MRRLLLTWNLLSPLVFAACWMTGHFWPGFILLFLGHMALLWAVLHPRCQWLVPMRNAAAPETVWLTFDDGPDPEDTPYILDLLKDHGLRAAFFVIGQKAQHHPHLVWRILAEGHVLGNHTQTHPQFSFWRLGPTRLRQEITACSETLERITGQPPKLFRPPVGHKNVFLHPLLIEAGMECIGWRARGRDGVVRDPHQVLRQLLPAIKRGSIVLMHEGRTSMHGGRLIQQTLPAVLKHLSSLD